MQKSTTISAIVKDTIWYIARPSIKYEKGIGTFASYDLVAYDCFERDIVEIVFDVTSDRDLVLRMCEKFNRYQLSPIHMEETILDMLQ